MAGSGQNIATGAVSGATTGTAVNPGWGTLLGGLLGAGAGAMSPPEQQQAQPANVGGGQGQQQGYKSSFSGPQAYPTGYQQDDPGKYMKLLGNAYNQGRGFLG